MPAAGQSHVAAAMACRWRQILAGPAMNQRGRGPPPVEPEPFALTRGVPKK